MYICICNAVTDRQIAEAQRDGHHTLQQISQLLGVGRCCGKCVPSAKAILEEKCGVKQYYPQISFNEVVSAA